MKRIRIPGVLLIYHHPLAKNASTILEHVNCFETHSSFPVWKLNTELGFPQKLKNLEFDAIVLHYSLFGPPPYYFGPDFLEYLNQSLQSLKICFFQDEYRWCPERFHFINSHKIDVIYTCLREAEIPRVYAKYSPVKKVIPTLTGYVSNDLVEKSRQFTVPDANRKIDISYRGRKIDYYVGAGGQEKYEIGLRFLEKAKKLSLSLDIEVEESQRIYGDDWLRLLAQSRAVLGVESGVSVFDLDGKVYSAWEAAMAKNPALTFEDFSKNVLGPYEGNVYLRTISPRHFEASALRVCQILYKGEYSGILQEGIHYIGLEKDFSNFDTVIEEFSNKTRREEITTKAFQDIIESRAYTYESFVLNDFDKILKSFGLQAQKNAGHHEIVMNTLNDNLMARTARAKLRSFKYKDFPLKRVLKPFLKPIVDRLLPGPL